MLVHLASHDPMSDYGQSQLREQQNRDDRVDAFTPRDEV